MCVYLQTLFQHHHVPWWSYMGWKGQPHPTIMNGIPEIIMGIGYINPYAWGLWHMVNHGKPNHINLPTPGSYSSTVGAVPVACECARPLQTHTCRKIRGVGDEMDVSRSWFSSLSTLNWTLRDIGTYWDHLAKHHQTIWPLEDIHSNPFACHFSTDLFAIVHKCTRTRGQDQFPDLSECMGESRKRCTLIRRSQ